MNPKVDWFFEESSKWQSAYRELRNIVLECDLQEELKWGCPCYTLQKNNVVLIHGFKDYCALLFMQGALINDVNNVLIQQTENVQAARQIRFKHVDDIVNLKSIIKDYILAAIEIQKSGRKFVLKKTTEFNMPEEFQNALNDMGELKQAFEALTPGRQRGYLLYFSSAKQTKTRLARIEKYIPKILDGKGLED